MSMAMHELVLSKNEPPTLTITNTEGAKIEYNERENSNSL